MSLHTGSSSTHATGEEDVHVQVSRDESSVNQRQNLKLKHKKWWISILICAAFVLIGRTLVTLLQNFYYVQSGRAVCDDPKQFTGTWIQAVAQNAAFPITAIFLILFFHSSSPKSNLLRSAATQPSLFSLLLLYIALGVLFAAYSELYMVGKTRTYFFPWIFATQLIFTPIFAAFINKHKFDRWIIISIILSIVATAVTSSDDAYYACESESYTMSIGAWCAFFGTVAFSLYLCIVQFFFQRIIIKNDGPEDNHNFFKNGFSAILVMQANVSLISTLICLVGLFTSGEFKDLKEDFETFQKGKALYVLNLIGLSVSWQVWSIGQVGLVFFTSSIFSNVANLCASPVGYIVVVLAFRFMDDELNWLKGGALLAGILGFGSYGYSLYKSKKKELQ